MNIEGLTPILTDEKKSFNYLLNKLNSIECEFCHSKKFYQLTKQRLRCSSCKHDYNPLKKTWFSNIKLKPSSWLLLVKLFELEISARRARKELNISYPTVLKAFMILRRCITEELAKTDVQLKGEIEADESYFGGRRKGKRGRGSQKKTIVFGILERNGHVSVSIVNNVSAEQLMNETVKKVRRGSIVYTDK